VTRGGGFIEYFNEEKSKGEDTAKPIEIYIHARFGMDAPTTEMD